MTTPAARPTRPGGVTLVAVLTWISGLLSIIGGGALIIVRDDADVQRSTGAESSTLVIVGLVSIIIGLVTIAVANGLLRGSGFARFLVTVLMLLEIVAGIYMIVKLPGQGVSAWVNIVIGVVVILLLWSGRASAFFRAR